MGDFCVSFIAVAARFRGMTQFHLFGLADHESEACCDSAWMFWGGTIHCLSDINAADGPMGGVCRDCIVMRIGGANEQALRYAAVGWFFIETLS